MPEFAIYWEGTVTGVSCVEAETVEKAIEKAKHSDDGIEIKFYPEDWAVDESLTKGIAEDSDKILK